MMKEFEIPKTCNERNFASQYKYVSGVVVHGKTKYKAIFYYYGATKRKATSKYFNTEKEAAIAVDKHLINIGKEPLNILVRKVAG